MLMHTCRTVDESGAPVSEDWQESQYWYLFYHLDFPSAQRGVLCMVRQDVTGLVQVQDEKCIFHKGFSKNHSRPYSVSLLLKFVLEMSLKPHVEALISNVSPRGGGENQRRELAELRSFAACCQRESWDLCLLLLLFLSPP